MSKILKLFFLVVYGFAFGWSLYYLPKTSYALGWIVTLPFWFGTIFFSTVGIAAMIWILANFWELPERHAKYWIVAVNIPVYLFCALVLAVSFVNWSGSKSLTVPLLAGYLQGFALFSMFGLLFVIGFYWFFLKVIEPPMDMPDLHSVYKMNKVKEITFGISAILICLAAIVLFVGYYLGYFSVSL
jgi:hypothetical protein